MQSTLLIPLLYSGFLYIIFTSFWQLPDSEYYFYTIFPVIIATVYVKLLSIPLYIFFVLYSTIFLERDICIYSYLYSLIGILVLFFFLNYLMMFKNSKSNDHSLKKLSIIDNNEEVQKGLMKKINQNIREKMTLITVYDKEALFFLFTIKSKRLLLHFPNKSQHLKNDIP